MTDTLKLGARAAISAVLAAGVIHFARPIAVSGQDAASIQVRAVLVDPGPLGEVEQAIEALVTSRTAIRSAGFTPGRVEKDAVVALLTWERRGAVVTVADLSR